MAIQNITYGDKSFINENSQIADINKIKDTDMNEIKNVVNNNANELASVETGLANINLTNFVTPTLSKASGTFSIASSSSITVATNSDGSLAKIYGQITCTGVTSNGVVSCPSSLRPAQDIIILASGIKVNYNSSTNNVLTVGQYPMTIKTDGTIQFPISYAFSSGETCRIIAINSLLYIKDFGDIETE